MILNSTHSTQKASSIGTGSSANDRSSGRIGTGNKASGRLQIRQTGNQTVASDATRLSSEAKTGTSSEGRMSGLLSGLSDWGNQETPSLDLGEGEMLSAGSQNRDSVSQLQQMLNGSGSQLEVDGVFGPRTAEAVRRYQEANNLTVDGIVGPQTLAALNGGGTPAPVDQGQSQPPADARQEGAGEAAGADQQTAGRSTSSLEGLPPRPENARGGREFMESIAGLPPGRQRDQAVLQEILSGNIPVNLRNMQEVVVNRGGHEIRMQATPDYLSIGSNEDNVRIPMTPGVAQAIADRTGTSLPTDRMVDDIYAQSRQLNMAPMSDNRSGISTYLQHDQRIDGQLGSGVAPNQLVSGHKKDLVIPARDGQVAIYGGRWAGGGLIQPYSNVHNDSYEDYSHGARLVSRQLVIDGRSMSLEDALADPQLAPLLTNHRSGSFRY